MRGFGDADTQEAFARFNAGDATGAAQLCQVALRRDKRNVAAMFLLAVAYMQERKPDDAEAQFARATKLDATVAEIWANRGNNQIALGNPARALEFLQRALVLRPDFPEALYNQAKLLADEERYDEALAAYERCVRLVPQFADALNNRGTVLAKLGRHDEALTSYDTCLAISRTADTLYNRGNALVALGRHEEALASYDASLAAAPDTLATLTNRANLLVSLRRYDEALASCDRAVLIAPDAPDVLDRRGNLLAALGRDEEAFASFDICVTIAPGYVPAWTSVMKLLVQRRRFEEAQKVIGKLLALDPDADFAQGSLALAKLSLCDWDGLAEVISALRDQVTQGKAVTLPFHTIPTLTSPHEQLLCARARVAFQFPQASAAGGMAGRYAHDRIRLAYLSADFREHPVSELLAGLIECHDRRRFEVIGISFGPDDDSGMRARLRSGFERFIDVDRQSDLETARIMRALEVDIAVDLTGFTQDARPGVLALRPAPIQVAYLGYPGTSGAPFIDYILADRTTVPDEDRVFYSERVVYLPDSYQPNERRDIAAGTPTRGESGLPERGFVFCCFNQNIKITPEMFDVWMRLLLRLDGSVLWLSSTHATAAANLRSEAMRRGVAAERLIFATRVARKDDHLARHRLADLFLDTLPYNAHASASDALWAGVPIVTCLGRTFAGRVAASLLHAIGLPELVTHSLAEYEALATRLASEPALLAAVKTKLAENRLTRPLFDIARFRRGIEAAYSTMYERHRRGEAPESFAVASAQECEAQ
jgi:predicted O-linked N-acetylglucosamine transferase (SPINDLY family)